MKVTISLSASCCVQGFNCDELLYYDYGQLDPETEKKLHCRRVDLDELIRQVVQLVTNTQCLEDIIGLELYTARMHTCTVHTGTPTLLQSVGCACSLHESAAWLRDVGYGKWQYVVSS
jgi:hypothetical protein